MMVRTDSLCRGGLPVSGLEWTMPYTQRGQLRRTFSLIGIPAAIAEPVHDGERWLVRLTYSSQATEERVCAITSSKAVYIPVDLQRALGRDAELNPAGGATFALLERVGPNARPTSVRL
jgi:hypothetical protein